MVHFTIVLDLFAFGFCTDKCHDSRDLFWVPNFAKESFDTRKCQGWEEIFEVHLHDDLSPRVFICVGSDRAPGDEAVGRAVDRHTIEDLVEDGVLCLLQLGSWRGDDAL